MTGARTRARCPGAEALDAWLRSCPYGTARRIADLLGLRRHTISNWRRGISVPSSEHRAWLQIESRGAVKASSWVPRKAGRPWR